MFESCGKVYEFVQEAETRWYSHYGMVLSLFRARQYLEDYKRGVKDEDLILTRAIDTIGSTSFWNKLNLVSEILRSLTIEIGICERTNSDLGDDDFSYSHFWGAADLERVWSSCLLTLNQRRRRLQRAKVLKAVQIKAIVNLERAHLEKLEHRDVLQREAIRKSIADSVASSANR
eukprot:IDg5343t1